MTERPNYFEQQQARDEREAAIRRQRERQQQIDRLAKEKINRRLEQFRVEAARRAEREAQRNRERGCCRPF